MGGRTSRSGSARDFCLGVHLARTEGRVAVERLLATLDDLTLAPDNDFAPEPSYLLHGLRALQLTSGAPGTRDARRQRSGLRITPSWRSIPRRSNTPHRSTMRPSAMR